MGRGALHRRFPCDHSLDGYTADLCRDYGMTAQVRNLDQFRWQCLVTKGAAIRPIKVDLFQGVICRPLGVRQIAVLHSDRVILTIRQPPPATSVCGSR